jgi:UDP-2-acetamido-2-deoxy-ribo-hexuluronate aminotransferase
MLELRNHGQDRRYHHIRIGINGRLDTIQAAVLLAKLDSFDNELLARGEAANRYTALLKDTVRTPQLAPHRTSAWAQYTIEVDHRDAVEAALRDAGVPTAVHYPIALHQQPVFGSSPRTGSGSFPHAERAACRALSLPMHPYLAPPDILRVADAVISCMHQATAR